MKKVSSGRHTRHTPKVGHLATSCPASSSSSHHPLIKTKNVQVKRQAVIKALSRNMAMSATTSKYYAQSLALPVTPFPLRPDGGSVNMEKKTRPYIGENLYHDQFGPLHRYAPGKDDVVKSAILHHRDNTKERNDNDVSHLVDDPDSIPAYRLHDGPPFANGNLHTGHFLNKSLKDISSRYKYARGYKIEFFPGWDCHGLPIELKANEATLKKRALDIARLKAEASSGSDNTHTDDSSSSSSNTSPGHIIDNGQAITPLSDIPDTYKTKTGQVVWGAHTPTSYHPNARILTLRNTASRFAQQAIVTQAQSMRSWSLLADYSRPYVTMDPTYECRETLVLGGLMAKGALYRQLMPVYWSPSSRTALAESELEYKDITSTAAYVSMPVVPFSHDAIKSSHHPFMQRLLQVMSNTPTFLPSHGNDSTSSSSSPSIRFNPSAVSFVIWTTTPWTLPANRAICVSPDADYALLTTNIDTTISHNGKVYTIHEHKHAIVIASMIDNLSSTWKASAGLNYSHFANYIDQYNSNTLTGDAITITPHGDYNIDKYGKTAIVSKGKNKGNIQDMIISRHVESIPESIIDDNTGIQKPLTINGKELEALDYFNPLALDLTQYLLSDCVDQIDTSETEHQNSSNRVVRYNPDMHRITTGTDGIRLPTSRIWAEPHVLTDAGSGCVHTAPGHGDDDYDVGIKHNIPIACPVDDKGDYIDAIGSALHGVNALQGGSKKVLALLNRTGLLLHQEDYEHRYPHDWRTMQPVMLRATDQWFCKLDQAKTTAKASLTDVQVTTPSARTRLTSFIDSRDKWCISRQRLWGLPLPVFYSNNNANSIIIDGHIIDTSSSEQQQQQQLRNVLNSSDVIVHVAKIFAVLGSQAWWQLPSWRLLPIAHRGPVHPAYTHDTLDNIVDTYMKAHNIVKHNIDTDTLDVRNNRYFTTYDNDIDPDTGQTRTKMVTHINGEPVIGLPPDYYLCPWDIGQDTVDVWLDSGSSWFSALSSKLGQSVSPHDNGSNILDIFKAVNHNKPISDLYLEGSDQHRGWFQSSLLLSSLLTNQSPFKALHSHGFVVDDTGRKMSKSLGNGIEPDTVILEQGHGVDVLRVWAASVDCSRDAVISKASIQHAIDFVRKYRSLIRFALGCLTTNPQIKSKKDFISSLDQARNTIIHNNDNDDNNNTTTTETHTQEAPTFKTQSWYFDPSQHMVQYNKLHALDQYILHELSKVLSTVTTAFESYQFHHAMNTLKLFLNGPLSSVYFDLSKDRLYAEGAESHSRRAALTTIYHIFHSLVKIMTPVIPHIAQEIFLHLPNNIQHHLLSVSADNAPTGTTNTIAHAGWVENTNTWDNPKLASHIDTVLSIRGTVNQCVEIFRQHDIASKKKEQPKKVQTKADKNNKKKNNNNNNDQHTGGNSDGDKDHDDTTTSSQAQPLLSGDVTLLDKVGSTNEIDVIIRVLPNNNIDKYNNTLYNDAIRQLSQSFSIQHALPYELLMVSSLSIHDNSSELPSARQSNLFKMIHESNQIKYQSLVNDNNNNAPDSHILSGLHNDPSTAQFLIHKDTISNKPLVSHITTINIPLLSDENTITSSSSSPSTIPLNVIVSVSKSTGCKCVRCWRFSSSPDTNDIQQDDSILSSYIQRAHRPLESLPETHLDIKSNQNQENVKNTDDNDDDYLCLRCDDLCVDE